MRAELEKDLVDDRFRVEQINPEQKYFKHVSRVHFSSQYSLTLELDINTTIYPIELGDTYLIKISQRIGEKNIYSPEDLAKQSEKDSYEYVMYGTVHQILPEGDKVVAYASFGGLLMRLQGSEEQIAPFRKDSTESRIYLKMRKS